MNDVHLNLENLTPDEQQELLKLLNKTDLNKSFRDFEPHDAQAVFLMTDAQEAVFWGGNRTGKTESLVTLMCLWASGEYPSWWTGPKMATPNRGRLIGPNLNEWVKGIVEPKLRKLVPRSLLLPGSKGWQHNPQTKGVARITFSNGSVVDVLSYLQDSSVFESWNGNYALFDEPPPRDIYIATIRGLLDLNGFARISATLLEQPWIFQLIDTCTDFKQFGTKPYREGNHELTLPSGGVHWAKTFAVHAITDENLYCKNWRGELTGGLDEKGLAFFLSKLKPEEERVRRLGQPLHLEGLVYTEFEDRLHIVEDDKVPCKGTMYCVLDPADSKPHAVAWFKVDPMGTSYCVNSLMFKGNIGELAKQIKQVEKDNSYDVSVRLLDPNKGQTPTAVSGQTWQEEIDLQGLWFDTDINDDVAFGHQKVKGLLCYDKTKPLDEVNHPKLYFARVGAKEMIYAIKNYIYDPNKNKDKNNDYKTKPQEKFKDLPDTLRYAAVYGLNYLDQETGITSFYNPSNYRTSSKRT
jgi:hypothetical protein